MTTRGGEPGTRPEGVSPAPGVAPVSGGALGNSGAAVPLLIPRVGMLSVLRWGKRGVVLAAGGEPVKGGAAGRVGGGGRVGTDPDPDAGGRNAAGIGLVMAVDQEGGTPWAGTGARFDGGRMAAGFIGSVVAAEMLGRGAIGAALGLSGRGGKLMRRVSRFGGSASGFSGSRGLPSSAIARFL